MTNHERLGPAVVLQVEDNPAEQRLVDRALNRCKIACDLRLAVDGEQAIDYLFRIGAYSQAEIAPLPDLVLLDLNLPKISGHQVLKRIKLHADLKTIPVIVLSTSSSDQEILESYRLGCNSFITKPVGVRDFIEAVSRLAEYWLRLVALPPKPVEL